MLFGNNSIHKTHYETLGVKEYASYEEIRTSYHSAILNSHPDKLQRKSEISNPDLVSGDRFLEVQRAWEILSDSRSRAIYDNELQALRQDAVAAEDVSLEDLMVEDAGEVLEFFYQCRCGDYFSVDSLELGKMGCTLLRDSSLRLIFVFRICSCWNCMSGYDSTSMGGTSLSSELSGSFFSNLWHLQLKLWKKFCYKQLSTMLFGNKSIHKTHYETLGVEEYASYEEIRASYRSAVLNSHPDKLQRTSEISNPNLEPGDRFLEKEKARKIRTGKGRAIGQVLFILTVTNELTELPIDFRLPRRTRAIVVDSFRLIFGLSSMGCCMLWNLTCINILRSQLEIDMGSEDGNPRWSVFDGVKIIPTTPEAVMAQINSAIAAFEYTHATALLQSPSSLSKNKSSNVPSASQYDARTADEAYKAGLAALAAGKLDEALHSLNLSLSKCPPDKTSAVAKLQSLISLTSQQLLKSPK
ncbi:hypothetical protein F0562_035906 [Nyssa sinensis]|uniref:J domain-containing protein n=1 Tax=Nyssa sinensis TaxID=561372 RepID=A0A5J5AHC9_9ASTE|nr:hypothetical protein F0562_035906 [Nyssa sinensis]